MQSNTTEIVVQHSIDQEQPHLYMMNSPVVMEHVPRPAEEAPPTMFHQQDAVITTVADPAKPILVDTEHVVQPRIENTPLERRPSPDRERGPDGRPVCTFWSQGKCFFGNECKFWHDMSNPPPIVPSDAEVHHFHVNKKPAPKIACKFFAVGECKYGPSCKFLHESAGLYFCILTCP